MTTSEAGAADLASRYIANGLAVFPLKPRDKIPATAHGFEDATKDIGKVLRWWQATHDANIGIATGAPSGVVVLDVDGDEGVESLRRLLDEAGVSGMPKTPTVLTGKGAHYYFRDPGGIRNSARNLPGLDVRADGGYVVAPPSIHPSGDRYEWATSLTDARFAEVPEFLLKALFKPAAKASATLAATSGADIPAGVQNETLFAIGSKLRGQGLSAAAIEAELLEIGATRCKPPADPVKVRDIAKRAAAYVPNYQNIADEAWQTRQVAKLAAAEEAAPAKPPRRVEHHNGADLVNSEEDALPEWRSMLEQTGFFVKGSSHLISAAPKVGKTELMIRCIRQWLDAGMTVRYISEETKRMWQRRLKGIPGDWRNFDLICGRTYTVDELLAAAFESPTDALVIDTVRSTLRVENENDNSEVARAIQPWLAGAEYAECDLYAIHHERKQGGNHGSGAAGGSALVASFDIILTVNRVEGHDNRRKIEALGRLIEPTDCTYEREEGGHFRVVYATADNAQTIALTGVQERALDVLAAHAQTTRAMYDQLAAPVPSIATFTQALESLVARGDALRVTGGRSNAWRLNPLEPSQRV